MTIKRNTLYLSCLAALASATLSGCGGGEEESGVPERPASPTNITMASKSISASEGDSGQRNTVELKLRLSRAHDKAIKVNYDMAVDNEFAEGRFELASGTETIAAGERQKNLEFALIGNDRYEPDGTVTITLSLDGEHSNVNLIDQSASLSIEDDDEVPTFNLTVSDVDVREGVGTVEIVAGLSHPTYKSVTGQLSFDGLASTNDYGVTSTNIEFAPDEVVSSTSINIFEDDIIEGSETIDIEVFNALNANLGNDTSMRIIIQGDLKLNDTGVTRFYNNGNFNSLTPDAQHDAQDADYGLDNDANYNVDNGYAGFFYNKIDGAGNAMPENANGHECVYDSHTGLTWEIKGDYFYYEWSDSSEAEAVELENSFTRQHYNNRNGRYMWNVMDAKINGGTSGGQNNRELQSPVLASQQCMFPDRDHPLHISNVTQKGCTSDKYEEIINKSALCGFVDWRLPTITELQTLVRYEDNLRGYDTDYFPDSHAEDASHTDADFVYLSSTPSVDNEASVWCFDAAERRVKLCNKTDYHHVRLVRGNQF